MSSCNPAELQLFYLVSFKPTGYTNHGGGNTEHA